MIPPFRPGGRTIQGIINEVRDISAATKRLLNRIEQRVIEGICLVF